MDDKIIISPDDIEVIDAEGYSYEVVEQFDKVPEVAKNLVKGAKATFSRIEKMLYTAPGFINTIKSSLPEETLQAVLTDEQKSKLAEGALKLMTKKDGSLMANLIDQNTKKIVASVPLKSVKMAPELTQAVNNYATQMQMAQIAEQIQTVQIAIEEVRKGQEFDRIATAYSCQQKMLQAMAIRNPELKTATLLRIAMDAEDSRNLLMQSQNATISFIKNEPESLWGKITSKTTPEKINQRMNELRDGLSAVNMVSLVEAMAYQEMGESDAAKQSLSYYADFIDTTYLSSKGLVERLDMIDPSTESYWSKTLPDIKTKIQALPCYNEELLEDNTDGEEV